MPDEPQDIYTAPAPGSLMRSCVINRKGLFRIARRDAELYSVQILGSGSWGRFRIWNAAGRVLFEQPSTFTGSFWLSGGSEGGIIVEHSSNSDHEAANLTVNYREKDQQIV